MGSLGKGFNVEVKGIVLDNLKIKAYFKPDMEVHATKRHATSCATL